MGHSKVDPHRKGKAPTAHPGYALALAHCTRCHGLPTPQQLPRETWPFVMTWMSNYLGYTNLYGPFQNNVDSIQIPSQPMVSESELQAISEYYLLYAPLEIRPDERSTALRPGSLKQFTPRPPPMQVLEDEIITLTHWDPSRHQLYLGRASHRSLQVFDAEGQILLQKACASEPGDVTPLPNGFRLTLMGHFLEDRLGGTVMDVSVSDASSLDTQTHVEGFHRLTQCLSKTSTKMATRTCSWWDLGQGSKDAFPSSGVMRKALSRRRPSCWITLEPSVLARWISTRMV